MLPDDLLNRGTLADRRDVIPIDRACHSTHSRLRPSAAAPLPAPLSADIAFAVIRGL